MKRKVIIQLVGDSWRVLYCERRKGQRYAAACFYAADHSQESVENWVRANPKLELLPKSEDYGRGYPKNGLSQVR